MITHIRGSLEEIEPTFAVIECHGVGYLLKISLFTYECLRKSQKKEVKLYTYYQVKEDGHTLYGFASKEERALFERLISVSGIGGNIALTLLSGLSISEIQTAISNGEVHTLQKIKGIGAKTAGRIILELKGKLPSSNIPAEVQPLSPTAVLKEDALAALVSLGFERKTMENKLDEILARSEIQSVEALIKAALKN
ncbi:MAG: Holliday junction branch migration protein RuvA [Bacteroidia bacterium]|nr:Holliday junction branch migration protein RuvA [Bacteroidia bacterium]MDW8157980.1 Holliday junction branch migration protein RuvA [Bacteroidia bacterium]